MRKEAKQRFIQAEEFTSECLRLIDEVERTDRTIIILKDNIPIAEIGPVNKKRTPLFGKMKGTAHYKSDITKPIDEAWD